MAKRNIIRAIIFLCIFLGIFIYLNKAFGMAESSTGSKLFNSFYAEKENSLDGIYLGSSAVNRYWNGTSAYNQYGMTIFALSTPSQPMLLYPYLIEEAEKTQDPDLYIMELRYVIKSAEAIVELGIRNVTDNMKFSGTRIKAINAAVDFAEKGENDVDKEKLNYYLPILKYHSRWQSSDLSLDDLLLRNTKEQTKGFFVTKSKSFNQEIQEEAAYTTETTALELEIREALEQILSYCDTLDKEILFVMSPYAEQDSTNLAKLNEAERIVKERGYTCLNFNTQELTEAMGLDYETDFYNAKHVNILGAEKYTDYLSAYIHEHYNLVDHRGDSVYKSWDDAYAYYLDFTAEKRKAMQE
ncbi:hypothetical protein LI177_02605 [bacterium 210820-DFI.6.37]|nr:hypothetical protein [bacterium 210820-DFI.6.37]